MFLFFPEVSSRLHLKNCFDTFAIFWQNKWKTQEKSEKCPKRYIYLEIFFLKLLIWSVETLSCNPATTFTPKAHFSAQRRKTLKQLFLPAQKLPKVFLWTYTLQFRRIMLQCFSNSPRFLAHSVQNIVKKRNFKNDFPRHFSYVHIKCCFATFHWCFCQKRQKIAHTPEMITKTKTFVEKNSFLKLFLWMRGLQLW